jgi:hypothetical protein
VKTRVDGFFEHAKAKPLLESRKEVRLVETREKVKCLSPEEVKKSLASVRDSVTHHRRNSGIILWVSRQQRRG